MMQSHVANMEEKSSVLCFVFVSQALSTFSRFLRYYEITIFRKIGGCALHGEKVKKNAIHRYSAYWQIWTMIEIYCIDRLSCTPEYKLLVLEES